MVGMGGVQDGALLPVARGCSSQVALSGGVMLEEEVEGGVLRAVFAHTWQLAATLQIDPTIMGPGNAHIALLRPVIPPSLWAGC